MKITCYNELQLEKIYENAYKLLKDKGAVNIACEEYHKPQTLKQLGFWFSCICNSVKDFYRQKGDDRWTTEAVKDLFYQALSPKIIMTKLNGETYEHSLHLSEMDRQQTSEFIDNSLNLIERANCFKGLILHPSIRTCWVHSIMPEEIKMVNSNDFPRYDKEYLEYRRKQCCVCCGQYGCESHHIRESESSGTALKANDWETISLCPTCHRYYHTKGKEWFNEQIHWILKYMSLGDFCKIQYNRWKNHLG